MTRQLLTGICATLLAAALLPAQASRAEAEEAFRKGAAAYDAAKFSEAASFFQKVVDAGFDEARVHYNLSCALFRSGELGRAMLHAQIACALDPTDREASENLDFMTLQLVDRPRAGAAFEDESLVQAADLLCSFVGANALAVGVLLGESFSVVLVVIALRQRRRSHGGVATPLAGASLLCTLLLVGALGLVAWRRESVREGIVLAEKAEALAGPGPTHPALFAVHAGLKVRIRGEREGWFQISIPSGLAGWLREEEVGRIALP